MLELVLATFISTLIIGILAVSLGFCLRVWERQQHQKPFNAPRILELLKMQLAQFNATEVNIDGRNSVLMEGTKHSLTLATDQSVRAISGGVPVIARYFFSPREKKLYYAEIPFDPHHPETFQEMKQLNPGNGKGPPLFFSSDMEDFALAYSGGDKDTFNDSWEGEAPPKAVMINWSEIEAPTVSSCLIYPNSLFTVKFEGPAKGGSGLDSPRSRGRRERRRR